MAIVYFLFRIMGAHFVTAFEQHGGHRNTCSSGCVCVCVCVCVSPPTLAHIKTVFFLSDDTEVYLSVRSNRLSPSSSRPSSDLKICFTKEISSIGLNGLVR